jgi:hypothetical protein
MVHSFTDEEGLKYEVYKCTEATPGFRYRTYLSETASLDF